MRHCILIILILTGFSFLQAQSEQPAPLAEDEVIRLKQASHEESHSPGLKSLEDPDSHKRTSGFWNMSVGSSYAYMKGYGSGMNLYAAPVYTLPLKGKWALHGGVIASSFTGFNGSRGLDQVGFNGSTTSLSLFAAGSYQMNDRLILHGAGVKQLMGGPPTPLSPRVSDNFSIGATYHLGNNISIGASLNVTNGHNYYGVPAVPSLLGSPVRAPFAW